jgi:hypothetical protein
MSNEARIAKCKDIFLFDKKTSEHTFFTLGFGFHWNFDAVVQSVLSLNL